MKSKCTVQSALAKEETLVRMSADRSESVLQRRSCGQATRRAFLMCQMTTLMYTSLVPASLGLNMCDLPRACAEWRHVWHMAMQGMLIHLLYLDLTPS